MQEVKVTHGKVYADRTAEPRAPHDGDNLDQAPVEVRTTRHEQKKAADRAQSTSEAGPVVCNHGNQHRRDSTELTGAQSDESQIRRNKDGGHSKYRDRQSRENESHGACC